MEFIAIFFLELLFLFFLSTRVTQSLSQVFYKITKSQKTTIKILALLFFPGVVIHELAHMLVAGVLFVPVGQVEFSPRITPHGVKLGSVAIGRTDPFRRMLIGFAPVFLGLIIILGSLYYFFPFVSIAQVLLLFYILFEVGNTMFSSRKDMEGTIEVLVVFFIFAMLGYILGIRIDISVVQELFSKEVVEFFTKADVFLSLPIVIDLVIWGGTRMVNNG